jgi:L-ascorbate metabolism protein UlaG (beta-lactamase superfamily)
MSNETLYRLSGPAAAEPLVNRWVAWSQALAPVASSLHLRHYQLNLLRSYLQNPRAHEEACRNPRLRSGRFVDIPEARAGEVAEFIAHTERVQAANLKFAASLIDFHSLLVEQAQGLSLDPFYARLPEELRGYVELVYDYYHRPTARVIESLLYESACYNPRLQSFRLFPQESDGSRAFFMNTPRLTDGAAIEWETPFDSPSVDEFFRLDARPQPLGCIRELLGLRPADEKRLLPMLTAEPAPPRPVWNGGPALARYFGHGCMLVEWNGATILTDPCVGVAPAGGVERYSFADFPDRIDYALVTHNHHDHYALETLLRLRHRIGCLVVPRAFGLFYGDISLKLLSRKLGFPNVVELDALESVPFEGGEITAVPFLGEHADLPHGKTAYVVRMGAERVLFGADSDCLDPRMYEHLRLALGPIETVFLGMECVGAPLTWSGGSFLPRAPSADIDQSRRYKGCDARRASAILDAVGATRVYIYAMGIEPWYEHLLGLAYTEDSPQLQEARRLIAEARRDGKREADILIGKREFLLTGVGRARASAARGGAGVADASDGEARAERDAEAQFSFD